MTPWCCLRPLQSASSAADSARSAAGSSCTLLVASCTTSTDPWCKALTSDPTNACLTLHAHSAGKPFVSASHMHLLHAVHAVERCLPADKMDCLSASQGSEKARDTEAAEAWSGTCVLSQRRLLQNWADHRQQP